MTVLSREEVDRALDRLDADSDRIATSLVEMDAHAGHQLLRGATLSGGTARRWAETSVAMATLWEQFAAYRGLVDRAREVRARRSRPGEDELAELTELLTGPVVELDSGQVPIERRGLTGASHTTQRITLDELLARMRQTFASVTGVLATAESTWSAVIGRLAIALCAEAAGDHRAADRYYRTVWRTDRAFVSAAFGLARALLALGERLEAVDVLSSVPEVSSHHVAAQLAAVRARVRVPAPGDLTEDDLLAAGTQLSVLELDAERRAHAASEVLDTALRWMLAGGRGSGTVLGSALTEDDLRAGLERCYRTLARHADNTRERIALVDTANRIRPRTWV